MSNNPHDELDAKVIQHLKSLNEADRIDYIIHVSSLAAVTFGDMTKVTKVGFKLLNLMRELSMQENLSICEMIFCASSFLRSLTMMIIQAKLGKVDFSDTGAHSSVDKSKVN